MSGRLLCLILGTVLSAVGCTKAVTEFEVLDEDRIPRPTFDTNKSTFKKFTTQNASAIFAISGECDQKIKGILGQAVGTSGSMSVVDSLAVNSATLNCASDGTFAFDLKSLNELFGTPVLGTTYEVHLRGVTTAGLSKASVIRIFYGTDTGVNRIQILSGATESQPSGTKRLRRSDNGGGNFLAEIRVTNQSNYNPASPNQMSLQKTSPSFKAKIGIAASAD